MEFKLAQHTHLIPIAHCHHDVFPSALTSRMGVPYLSKIFSWYLSTDKAFLFFVEEEGKVVGYAGGMIVDGTLAHGSASSLTQHTFTDSIKTLITRPWLLFHPEFISRYALFARNILIRIRNKFRVNEVRSAVRPVEPYTGLVVIGVHPTFQGKGYGSAILTEFENRTAKYGLKRMLLTVHADNAQAIAAYKRNGWYILSTNSKSVSMEKRLS